MESSGETDPPGWISRSGFQGVCPYVVMVCVSGWLDTVAVRRDGGEKPLKSSAQKPRQTERQYLRGFLMGGKVPAPSWSEDSVLWERKA